MTTPTEDVGENSATETLQLSRRLAGWMPRWHPWVTYHGSADWRIDGESAYAESKMSQLFKNGRKMERKLCLKVSE